MNRRAALIGLATIPAACASTADRISFDRGEFALTYAKLYTFGQNLLATAIARNTKGGVLNAYAQSLKGFSDELALVGARVEKAIIEAPQQANDAQNVGLSEVTAILSKSAPFILPLLAAV